jgi:hypothetical protein
MVAKQPNLYNLGSKLYNPIIYYFDAYFSLFLTKDPLLLPRYTKLTTNVIQPPTSIQRALSLHVYENNLNYNNLDCQTSTSRLYNLNYNPDYTIYKLKQTCPNC